MMAIVVYSQTSSHQPLLLIIIFCQQQHSLYPSYAIISLALLISTAPSSFLSLVEAPPLMTMMTSLNSSSQIATIIVRTTFISCVVAIIKIQTIIRMTASEMIKPSLFPSLTMVSFSYQSLSPTPTIMMTMIPMIVQLFSVSYLFYLP